MRAFQVTETSGPDGLRLADVPEPASDGLVLVEVKAAGVSFPDLLLSQGLYQLKPPLPFVPGVEAAGVVASAPDGSGFAPGDRVAAYSMLGGWAERMAVPATNVFRLPERLSFAQGAGWIMNYQTAHFALGRRGRLRSGETVLVHGAAGGVGTAGVQVAKAMGARVIAVVSTGEKAAVAKDAGADETVLTTSDWVAEVKERSGGGVDVVLDPVGGERLQHSLRVLAEEGRLLVVGFAEGSIPQIAANRLLLKNVDAVGVAWGAFVMTRPELVREIGEDLARMAEEGYVRPLVGQTFAFEDAADALRCLAGRQARGKVVLSLER